MPETCGQPCGDQIDCIAVFCSVLQCVAVRCSVLQCVAVCLLCRTRPLLPPRSPSSTYEYIAMCSSGLHYFQCVAPILCHLALFSSKILYTCWSVLECVAVYCSVLHSFLCVAPILYSLSLLIFFHKGSTYFGVCWSVLECVAMCCNVLQCVAMCYNVL